jgi:hypothetical protein
VRKLLLATAFIALEASAGITELHYANGLSFECEYLFGEMDKDVTRTDVRTSPSSAGWLQYFDHQNWSDALSTFRIGMAYNRPFLSFLAAEAGLSLTTTDEDSYSNENSDLESFSENVKGLSLQLGMVLHYRFLRMFNVFIQPSLELVNEFETYHYEAMPPFSDKIDERQVAYQFNPAFAAKTGFEFIPGGKIFGIALIAYYRYYKSEVKEITVIPDRVYKETISYPSFGLGVKCSLYLPKK